MMLKRQAKLLTSIRWSYVAVPLLLVVPLHCYKAASFVISPGMTSLCNRLQAMTREKHNRPATTLTAFSGNTVENPNTSTSSKTKKEKDVQDSTSDTSKTLQQKRFQMPEILKQPNVRKFLRDSGWARTLIDASIVFRLSSIIEQYPNALVDYLHISGVPANMLKQAFPNKKPTLDFDVRFDKYQYGTHERQVMHVYNPVTSNDENDSVAEYNVSNPILKTVAFVHGGAWGSGFPALYRLLALPFLQQGYQVAIIGYRTYPCGTIQDQVDDVISSIKYLRSINEKHDITLMGHSSGAHISLTALLTLQQQRHEQSQSSVQHHHYHHHFYDQNQEHSIVDRFVGLSGVYSIPSHFIHEQKQGVHEVSPMATASGGMNNTEAWNRLSPIYLINQQEQQYLQQKQQEQQQEQQQLKDQVLDAKDKKTGQVVDNQVLSALEDLPPMLIAHGGIDSIVPPTSSKNLFKSLQQLNRAKGVDIDMDNIELQIWDGIDHAEIIYHLMFGGPAREKILHWLDTNIGKKH